MVFIFFKVYEIVFLIAKHYTIHKLSYVLFYNQKNVTKVFYLDPTNFKFNFLLNFLQFFPHCHRILINLSLLLTCIYLRDFLIQLLITLIHFKLLIFQITIFSWFPVEYFIRRIKNLPLLSDSFNLYYKCFFIYQVLMLI